MSGAYQLLGTVKVLPTNAQIPSDSMEHTRCQISIAVSWYTGALVVGRV